MAEFSKLISYFQQRFIKTSTLNYHHYHCDRLDLVLKLNLIKTMIMIIIIIIFIMIIVIDRVLKLILLRAPMLRLLASVNSLLQDRNNIF